MLLSNIAIPTVRTTSVTNRSSDVLLTLNTSPIITGKFIMVIVNELPSGKTSQVVAVQDNAQDAALVTPTGGYVRADMLSKVIEYRKLGVPEFRSVEGCIYKFRAEFMLDPLRVVIYDHLPYSSYEDEVSISIKSD